METSEEKTGSPWTSLQYMIKTNPKNWDKNCSNIVIAHWKILFQTHSLNVFNSRQDEIWMNSLCLIQFWAFVPLFRFLSKLMCLIQTKQTLIHVLGSRSDLVGVKTYTNSDADQRTKKQGVSVHFQGNQSSACGRKPSARNKDQRTKNQSIVAWIGRMS